MTDEQHLWSGRFAAAPDADVFRFQASFAFDRRLFEDDVQGSLAWVEALERAGVLSAADGAAIREGLEAIRAAGSGDPAYFSGEDEDVHAFVERRLIERVGESGRRLHTGRSRNEQVSLDLRLYLRRRLPEVQRAVVQLVDALAGRAAAAGATLMPAYTHLRRAQPVLVAHFFLAHAAALRRDHARLAVAADEADALPLGSGAVTGTSYPIDVGALAQRLGFSRLAANSLDASSDRDFVAAMLHACTLVMVHLSRLAEDVILFSGDEFGFFGISDSVSTGSSLMPQKKNPDPLELVRGKAGRVLGRASGWLATMKGLPSGYNKDLQEDKEAVFDAEDTVIASLQAVAAVTAGLEIRPLPDTAAGGLSLATDVADYLVGRGLPFRRAHEVVGAVVRDLLATGRDFDALTPTEWQRHHHLFEADVVERITARGAVEARTTPQSTNPAAVQAALDDVRRWVAAQS